MPYAILAFKNFMHPYIETIRKVDKEVARALDLEINRQRNTLEMIASENFTDPAVLEAQGSVLTNKYAEGYPGKRYYGGCHYVDIAEQLAIDRAKKLFGAEHANVQPHAGAQANFAAYLAFLKPKDTVLGMNLSHGGHLTHGSPVNVSGIYFNFIPYGVRESDERIDYDNILALGKEHHPKMIVAGATAYPRVIDFPKLRKIADEVGALLLVDMAHIAGLVAAGVHPSPVPYADIVTSTTHKTLRGPRSGFILCKEIHAKAINKAVFPGSQGGPLMHVIAAKAVAFKLAMTPAFKKYQRQIVKNAVALADGLKKEGLRLVTDGTDNHLVLVDLRSQDMTGKEGEAYLDAVGITVNKNTIPFDPNPPFVTSGLRIGTPALTSRGMGEGEMRQVAVWIGESLRARGDAMVAKRIKKSVAKLCAAFPLYPYRRPKK